MQRIVQPDCHEHKAASTLGKTRSNVMDIRGIGTICCARHGCFAAGGTCDFPCGERYVGHRSIHRTELRTGITSMKPVDNCLHNVWKLECDFDEIQRQQIFYDIWCRYGVNLEARFKASGYSWPELVETMQGIGVWHIYGHKLACFSRYSPLYAHRCGIVDGEIVETLWALLNDILSSCRGMSLGNRRETIEAGMDDINFKKTINMGMHQNLCG